MSIHGHLALGIAAAAWLACAYWFVSYVRMASVLVRWIEDSERARGTRVRSSARRLEWVVLFGSSRALPKDERFQDQLGDARWAAGLALFFWTIGLVATGMLSLPASS